MISCFHAGVGRQTHHICGQCQDLLLQSCAAASLWIWRLPHRWQAQGPRCSRPAPENIPRSGMLMLFGNVTGSSYIFSVLSLGELGGMVLVKDIQISIPTRPSTCGWTPVFPSQRWGLKDKTKPNILLYREMKKYFVSYSALSDFKLIGKDFLGPRILTIVKKCMTWTWSKSKMSASQKTPLREWKGWPKQKILIVCIFDRHFYLEYINKSY